MPAVKYIILIAILFIIEIAYFKVARRYGIVDRPSKRGSSQSVVLRGGGIIFPIAALLLFVADGFSQPLFMVGLLIVSALSFIDDIRSLTPKLRLSIQVLAMLMLIVQLLLIAPHGITIASAAIIVIAGLIVCTGAMNIFNFMDGINGITGGYALVVLAAIAFTLYHGDTGSYDIPLDQVPQGVFLLATVTIAADIVFCFFNFRTHTRCFAGDVGSVSIAFVILFLTGYIIVATGDASWLAFLVVYGVDGCLTIMHRIMLHENISLPHRKHAYQIMANELHIPHCAVSAAYMAIQAVCCAAYIAWPGYLTLLVEIAILAAAYVIFMKKFYHLHVESGNA